MAEVGCDARADRGGQALGVVVRSFKDCVPALQVGPHV